MADFPYTEDGVVQGAFTERFRYPVVTTTHPRWNYITAVMVDDPASPFADRSVRPTDAELLVVASFHDQYIDHWYRESYKKEMRDRPFDIDGGANGRLLVKYSHGGWGWRLRTWTYGPTLVPAKRDDPWALVALLDRIHDDRVMTPPSDRWAAWKAEHADVFEAVSHG